MTCLTLTTRNFINDIVPKSKIGPVDQEEWEQLLGQVSLMTWEFGRSMKCHLSPPDKDKEDYVNEIKLSLRPEQVEALIGATHCPNRFLYYLSVVIKKACLSFHLSVDAQFKLQKELHIISI